MTRTVSIALAVAVVGCAPRTVPAPAADGVRWSPFHWVSADLAGRHYDRVAIYVPIASPDLGGRYWLQLDTGAESALWIYRAPLAQLLSRRGVAYDSTRAVSIDGTIGAYPLRQARVQVQRYAGDTVQAGDTLAKIGTLGLGFLQRRVLLLDLPRGRFALLDSTEVLPAWIERAASWVPVDHRNGKMFIPLTVGGTVHRGFFYDSGASLFALSTTPELWREVTGRTGDEPDNTVLRGPSFGQEIVFRGAPVRGRVSVGAAALENPLAFYVAEGPERLDFHTWGFPVEGLIGNALFADRYLVVVDLPRRRFGLVRSAPG
ncbi:MAG: hypothetical protein ACJ8J0_18760 [Longimicrobiaceae bacterium]